MIKKILILLAICFLFFSSCATTRVQGFEVISETKKAERNEIAAWTTISIIGTVMYIIVPLFIVENLRD